MSKKLDKHEVGGRPKGSRLARRARSFKEDILGKIHQMRTPGRASSPQQHKAKSKSKESCLDLEGQQVPARAVSTSASARVSPTSPSRVCC